MQCDLREGMVTIGAGAMSVARAGRTGALITASGHGAFTEPAMRAGIMEACTPVAGVAPGTALSTTPPLALWNPPSSGKNLFILKSYMGYISGTLGGGSIVYAIVPSQATVPTTGTELIPQCSMIGMPRGVGRAFQGSTLAATPTILRPAFVLGAFVGTTAVPPDPALDLVDGAICVTPGSVLCMQGIAGAGTTPLVLLSLVYEEVAI